MGPLERHLDGHHDALADPAVGHLGLLQQRLDPGAVEVEADDSALVDLHALGRLQFPRPILLLGPAADDDLADPCGPPAILRRGAKRRRRRLQVEPVRDGLRRLGIGGGEQQNRRQLQDGRAPDGRSA